MTEQEIAGLGPAFATYLGRFRGCFLQKCTAAHFDNYCKGLLSDLPRKTVEPIALEAGTAVRTLQEFLTTTRWDHYHMRDLLQRQLADTLAELPTDTLGTVGIIDETSCRKWGDETPGVRRQLHSDHHRHRRPRRIGRQRCLLAERESSSFRGGGQDRASVGHDHGT